MLTVTIAIASVYSIVMVCRKVLGAIQGPILGKKVNQELLDKIYGPFFQIFVFVMAISI